MIRIHWIEKNILICVIGFFIIVVAGQAGYAGEPVDLGEKSPGSMFLDAVIYRPVGIVAIPVGTALFIITSPFSALGIKKADNETVRFFGIYD